MSHYLLDREGTLKRFEDHLESLVRCETCEDAKDAKNAAKKILKELAPIRKYFGLKTHEYLVAPKGNV